jgi:hypothetical protein
MKNDETSPNTSNLQLVNSVLRYTNMENLWPFVVYQLESEPLNIIPAILPYNPQGYVIFIEPENEQRRLNDSLVSQVMTLGESLYFNPRARGLLSW